MTDLTERLRELLANATPGDLSTAERHTENETVECPLCHEGEIEASDYCNIDGKALGVQFYGIGKEFGAHERLWSETLAALPDLLITLETLTQENARLREAGWRDIESAPKDGTQFLALVSNGWYAIARAPAEALQKGWPYQWWLTSDRQSYPVVETHSEDSSFGMTLEYWMPLPPAPARKALGGGDEQ